jgi:hypothetical protein
VSYIRLYFILFGGENIYVKEKRPCWAFRWLNDNDGRAHKHRGINGRKADGTLNMWLPFRPDAC